jgi:hypothetical protein
MVYDNKIFQARSLSIVTKVYGGGRFEGLLKQTKFWLMSLVFKTLS